MPGALGWIDAVFLDWPGPIAHEYRRLADLMPDSPRDSLDPNYKVVGAFLQLRDFVEVLVKLPTILMLRDADRLGLNVKRIKSSLLGKPPSYGSWLESATELSKHVRPRADACTTDIAGIFRDERGKTTPLSNLLHSLVQWRNQELGHGALRMDLDALADELADRVRTVNQHLAPIAEQRPWTHLTLRLERSHSPLIGSESIRSRHDPADGVEHVDRVAALLCAVDGQQTPLDLAPYVAARTCSKCQKQDVFFFNSRAIDTATKNVQYLDYMMGHLLIAPQAADRKWADEVQGLMGSGVGGAVGDKWVDDNLAAFLDSTNLDRKYAEPTYLLEAVRDFLATHDRGILWLRAPAHTGKTVFASLAPKLLAQDPGDVLVASLLIKREYRFGLGMFEAFIEKTFHAGRTSQYQRKFCWDERRDESMPDCFVKEAAGLVERARELSIAHDRVLLILDGMDELPSPGAYGEQSDVNSIAALLPPADSLPAGMYLLLTSRPNSGSETPPWVLERMRAATEAQTHARIVDVTRDTESYRRLLRRWFDAQRLNNAWRAGNVDNPDELYLTLGDRADWTFLYFSHLLRLLRDGVIKTTDLNDIEERGDRLFFAYVARLESLLGEKEYERVRELLLALAACEEAHAQAAGIVPPLFFDALWQGVPLDQLAGLLNEICVSRNPGKVDQPVRVSPRLLFVLQSVSDVLRSFRAGDAHASYAIGLKGLVEAMREDRMPGGWAQRLDETHHRLVRDAIAAERTFSSQSEDQDMTASEDYLLWNGWWHARALLNLGSKKAVEMAMTILPQYSLPSSVLLAFADHFDDEWQSSDACETISLVIDHLMWKTLQSPSVSGIDETEKLAAAFCNRALVREKLYDGRGAAEDYEQAIQITRRAIEASSRRGRGRLRCGLALAMMGRGAIRARHGDRTRAAEDFKEVVRVFEALRKCPKSAWKKEVDDLLATALMNRGMMRSEEGNLRGACDDYGRAISLLKLLRNRQNSRWDPDICRDLASTLTNRGLALEAAGDYAAASRDFGNAISLLEKYIDRHVNDWKNDAWHTLAEAYGGRGGLTSKGVDPERATKDFTQAIFLLTSLRDFYQERCPTEVAEQLAAMYRNRGHARKDLHHFRRAIADLGRAIAASEALRQELGDRWTPAMNESLVETYRERAGLHEKHGDVTAAATDREIADKLSC